uniref:Uncharacterized protein n=1 Tax=Oryza barthii TaxID=65489 RepID=A0A0D3FXC8_9ORYZ
MLGREKADAVKEVEELRVKSEEQCRELASVGRELASVRELVREGANCAHLVHPVILPVLLYLTTPTSSCSCAATHSATTLKAALAVALSTSNGGAAPP